MLFFFVFFLLFLFVLDKDGLTVPEENSPEKFKYIEEGTEEAYPEGFVRGLYTFTDEDGIPATVEYEAGPEIGFVVKKLSKGNVQLDQLGQGTGSTSLNTNTFIVPSSVQEDSSEGEPMKYNVNSNEKPLESPTDEYFSPKPRPKTPTNQEHYQDDDSTQITSFTKDQPFQNDTRIQSEDFKQEELIEQPDGEEEKEIPMNAAYRFGFSVPKQSRHEEADTLGNVQGNYSYVDGAGLLTKVEYEAGAKKGFIIKQMTHEHIKTPQTSRNSEINHTQNLTLPENYVKQDSLTKGENVIRKEMHSEKTIVSNQHRELNNQKEHVDLTFIDGYEVSPYVLKEYVDERNLPVRSEFNDESPDKDSAVASGSIKYFSFAHPESFNFKGDGSYDHQSTHTNEAVQTHLAQEEKTDLAARPYSIFFRDNDSGIQQEAPTITGYEYFQNLPYKEPRPENTQPYTNVFNKEVEPYRTESNPGFSVYRPPLTNLPATIDSFNPDNAKKTGVHKPKKHHKHKKIVKRPLHMAYNRNFTNLQPDGAYSFAYRTKEHSREQSIDRNGNIHYSYQIKTKKDGNTLVIFSAQVPPNLVPKNDEVMLSQEKGKDYFAGSNEYLADPSADKPYYLRGTTHPSNSGFSTQLHVSRNVNIGPNPNRKRRVVRRGIFRQPRSTRV